MTTRADIIAAARDWLGTKHIHQGRLKGVACDCGGLVIGVARDCGIVAPDFDVNGYPRTPDPKLMRSVLDKFMDPVQLGLQKPGDVLFIVPRRIPQHTGILTFANTIIHAIDERRGVSEHILDDRWRAATVAVFSYRGLAD